MNRAGRTSLVCRHVRRANQLCLRALSVGSTRTPSGSGRRPRQAPDTAPRSPSAARGGHISRSRISARCFVLGHHCNRHSSLRDGRGFGEAHVGVQSIPYYGSFMRFRSCAVFALRSEHALRRRLSGSDRVRTASCLRARRPLDRARREASLPASSVVRTVCPSRRGASSERVERGRHWGFPSKTGRAGGIAPCERRRRRPRVTSATARRSGLSHAGCRRTGRRDTDCGPASRDEEIPRRARQSSATRLQKILRDRRRPKSRLASVHHDTFDFSSKSGSEVQGGNVVDRCTSTSSSSASYDTFLGR